MIIVNEHVKLKNCNDCHFSYTINGDHNCGRQQNKTKQNKTIEHLSPLLANTLSMFFPKNYTPHKDERAA